jgi:UDP:flavonoid glycosyltransferase YjiC (YdhE family)
MVTQCGLGTVAKAITFGVPLLCLPLIADQPDNAARVVARGVGIRVRSDAQPGEISAAIRTLLTESRFRQAASVLATTLRRQGDATQKAVEEIEAAFHTQSFGASPENADGASL